MNQPGIFGWIPGNPGGALVRLDPKTPEISEATLYAPSVRSGETVFTQTTSARSTAPSELPSEDEEVTSEPLLINNLALNNRVIINTRYPELSGNKWRY